MKLITITVDKMPENCSLCIFYRELDEPDYIYPWRHCGITNTTIEENEYFNGRLDTCPLTV